MNIETPKALVKRPIGRVALSAMLTISMFAAQCQACDFCAQIPRVPFAVDQLAAIEVALATRSAADEGLIDLNPVVVLTSHRHQVQQIPLSKLPAARLVSDWIGTRPAQHNRSLRCVCEVVFVDTDAAFRLDIRLGEIIGCEMSEPSDLRIVTTKAGFLRLLKVGLANCEEEKLAIVESTNKAQRQGLTRLFPGTADAKANAMTMSSVSH